jgi:UDP-N-acetylglucosamine:LPS N-acetylglucosamine transferase
MNDPQSTKATPTTIGPDGALILWSSSERGLRSVGRLLSGLLAAEPHALSTVEFDLGSTLGSKGLLVSLASLAGKGAEIAAFAALAWPAVEALLSGRRPRVIVALDPPAAAVAGAWRTRGLLRAPVVGVLSGLHLDPLWGVARVDRLSVADAVQAEAALAIGLPAECIVPSGIPVCGGFSSVSPDEKAEHRRRHGIALSRPVVLVVTDGLGEETVASALFQLGLLDEKASILFDVAYDDGSAELLRRRAPIFGVRAQMFGKVEDAGQLWAAADLVVARHHLYVEQRALSLRLPYIVLLPKGEAELAAAASYTVRRIGRSITSLSTLAAELELQIVPETLEASRRTIVSITKRKASDEIGRLIAQVAAQSERILEEARTRGLDAAPTSGKGEVRAESPAEAAPRRSALETIGAPDGRAPERAGDLPLPEAAGPELIALLAAAEVDANRVITEEQAEAERWTRRARLAEQAKDGDLVREAERQAERHTQAMHQALAELARLAERRRAAARAAAPERGPSASRRLEPLEETFRRMELDDALSDLKRRMDRKG